MPESGRLRLRAALLAVAVLVVGGRPVGAQQEQEQVQDASGVAVCADGVITSIDLDRRTVFDPESTGIGILAWSYRLLNVLHVRTQPSFIRRELLVQEGDCYDDFLVSESERLLDGYGFLESARITTEDDPAGGRRLLVETRDDWSTQVDVGVTYDGGPHLERFEVTEENFLGQGVFAEFTHRERREVRAQSFSLSTPRLFGRTDASIEVGRDRPGGFFDQYVRYPFVGETGTYSVRQGYGRGTSFYAFAVDPGAGLTQVLVPQFREVMELSLARRFGERGKSLIAGATLSRDVTRFGPAEASLEDDLSELVPLPGAMPPDLARQLVPSSSTRLWLHLGARRLSFQEYRGLDGLRDRLLLGLGYYVGASIGRGVGAFAAADAPGIDEIFARANGSFTAAVGSSVLHGGAYVESRRVDGAWRDVLADAEMVAYLRSGGLPGQTFFLRSSFAGGWRTQVPFQLSLGGREGVRALPEDAFPGGRAVRFVFEDRVVFPWPTRSMDLGMTAFADLGRMWAADAPYGTDSGWQKTLGIGLRVGLPARTRHIWRADVAFPVGSPGRSPIFRLTFDFNRLSRGFFHPDMIRSRRFDLGAGHF